MRRSFHGVKSLGAAILALVCLAVLAYMALNAVNRVRWNNLVSWLARTPAPLTRVETSSPGISATIQPTFSSIQSSLAAAPSISPVPTHIPAQTPRYNVEISDWASEQIAGMSLAQKIGQVLVVAVDGHDITEDNCQYIQKLAPGGIFLRPDNVFEPGQLRRFSAGLQDCIQSVHAIPLLISIDHEGQYANRFHEGTTTFPNAIAQGATGDPNVAYQVALAAGQELAYSGVNMVFGPVADVQLNFDNKVIAKRTFGGDPAQVSQFVAQAVQGYQQAGLIPVLKHFPGHGWVADDSYKTFRGWR
jgi:beta-N-acetylhexosaminidase